MAVGTGRVRMPHTPNPASGDAYNYVNKRRGRPMLFQVTDPVGQPLWPFMLALHTNPSSLEERMAKSKNVVMTYGGFVEFHWPDELDSLSASMTTGAFIGPNVGLVSGSDGRGKRTSSNVDTRTGATGRQGSMAWERQEDLLDLFRHNGAVYNGTGQPVLRGQIMCIYDRGIFIGHFTTFSVKENDEKAFSFELDWDFKIEKTIYLFPSAEFDSGTPTTGVDVNGITNPDPLSVTAQDLAPRPNVDENTPGPSVGTAADAIAAAQNEVVNGNPTPPENAAIPDEEN